MFRKFFSINFFFYLDLLLLAWEMAALLMLMGVGIFLGKKLSELLLYETTEFIPSSYQ